MDRHGEFRLDETDRISGILRSHREIIPDRDKGDVRRVMLSDQLQIREEAGVTEVVDRLTFRREQDPRRHTGIDDFLAVLLDEGRTVEGLGKLHFSEVKLVRAADMHRVNIYSLPAKPDSQLVWRDDKSTG